MKTFCGVVSSLISNRSGGKPFWILKVTIGGVDYYLSDKALTITDWQVDDVVVYPLISEWGNISEQGFGLGEANTDSLSVTITEDPTDDIDIVALFDGPVEGLRCDLLLWDYDWPSVPADNQPEVVYRGVIDEASIDNEEVVSLTINNCASVVYDTPIGVVVDVDSYPSADPDDVGEIIPISFGKARNVPARCIVGGLVTTLKNDITSGATTCTVARPDGIVANTTKFKIDSEVVKVTAVNMTTGALTISRAQDSTTAAAHTAGTPLIEKTSTDFFFKANVASVSSVDRVFVKAGEMDVDITDQCTKYTGQVGDTNATHDGCVVKITQAQAAVIKARSKSIVVTDPGHEHPKNITVVAVTPDDSVKVSGADWSVASSAAYDGNLNYGGYTPAAASTYSFYRRQPASSSINPVRARVAIHAGDGSNSNTAHVDVWVAGAFKADVTVSNGTSGGGKYTTSWFSFTDIDDLILSTTEVVVSSSQAVRIWEIWWEFEHDPTTATSPVGISGNFNSLADMLIGGRVYVDVTSNNTDPIDVVQEVLDWAGGYVDPNTVLDAAVQVGTPSTAYKFNGAIIKRERVGDILWKLAFSCRSFFKISGSTPKLIYRDGTTPTEDKEITVLRANSSGQRVISREKTPIDEIITKITARYAADLTKGLSDDRFTKTYSYNSPTAVLNESGLKERPELFDLDFLDDSTTAPSDIVQFYLSKYETRRWRYRLGVLLDNCDLEFGDVILYEGRLMEVVGIDISPTDLGVTIIADYQIPAPT